MPSDQLSKQRKGRDGKPATLHPFNFRAKTVIFPTETIPFFTFSSTIKTHALEVPLSHEKATAKTLTFATAAAFFFLESERFSCLGPARVTFLPFAPTNPFCRRRPDAPLCVTVPLKCSCKILQRFRKERRMEKSGTRKIRVKIQSDANFASTPSLIRRVVRTAVLVDQSREMVINACPNSGRQSVRSVRIAAQSIAPIECWTRWDLKKLNCEGLPEDGGLIPLKHHHKYAPHVSKCR